MKKGRKGRDGIVGEGKEWEINGRKRERKKEGNTHECNRLEPI